MQRHSPARRDRPFPTYPARLLGCLLVGLIAATGTGCIVSADSDFSDGSSHTWEEDHSDPFDDGSDDSAFPSGDPDDNTDIDTNDDGFPDDRRLSDCVRLEHSLLLPADRGDLERIDSNCLAIDGGITVQGNVSELPELKKFEYLYVRGDVRIVETRGLTHLRAFDGLRLIGGTLDIKANFDLESLSCMPHLADVIGDVRITNHPNLTSVRGFGWLQRIGGDLIIESNRALVELQGFPALQYIADYRSPRARPDPSGETGEPASRRDADSGAIDPHLIIRDNPNLETVRGFRALTDVDGDIRFIDNPKLHALVGFEQLEFLTGELIVRNSPQLADLSAFDDMPCLSGLRLQQTGLDSLQDLSGIHEIGEIEVADNDSLTTLDGFAEMVRIRGPVVLENNDSLTDLDGLWGANRIGSRALLLARHVDITEDSTFGNDEVSWPTTYREHPNFNCTVTGELDDEQTFGDVRIRGNDALTAIDDIPLREVGGQLVIADNDSLSNISGFDSLVSTHGLQIASNKALEAVRGFGQLRRARQQIEVIDNPNLVTIDGFDRLHPQSIGWDDNTLSGIIFQNNQRLQTIDGFNAIEELTGALVISENPAIRTISGFSRLADVGQFVLRKSGAGDLDAFAGLDEVQGDFSIVDNDGLQRLDDFQSLHRIEGNLSIERNDDLTSLIGLANLDSVDNGIYIQDNPSLPRCEAEALARSLSFAEFKVVEDNGGGGSC
jgi:hypothetical protein